MSAGVDIAMEHVFKVRSSEFVEDELWTKKCVGEFQSAQSSTLDRRSKRDVCSFDVHPSPTLFKVLKEMENARVLLTAECKGQFMFAWTLFFKDAAGNVQCPFDPLVSTSCKVSNTSGDIRTIKQTFHGVLTAGRPFSTVDIRSTSALRQSNIAKEMGVRNFDRAVELIHKGNFVYLCQRNNFQFSKDHFAEVEDRFDDDDEFEPVVILKRVDGLESDETSNNIEIELLKLFDSPIFHELIDHIADQHGLHDSCLEYHHTTDENNDFVDATCISLELLQHLAQFTRDVSEERRSITEDMKKTKVLLGIYRYFNETSSVVSDEPLIFRLTIERESERGSGK